jgi:hypothetical protein
MVKKKNKAAEGQISIIQYLLGLGPTYQMVCPTKNGPLNWRISSKKASEKVIKNVPQKKSIT